MNNYLKTGILAIILCGSCQLRKSPVETSLSSKESTLADSLRQQRNLEAREDSLEMMLALEARATIGNGITADLETEAVASAEGEDAADDPAIWFNAGNPAGSLVLGTDKNAGIYVYGLDGKIRQFVPSGRINNIDLRPGFPAGDKEQVLVAGSNRSNNAIQLLLLDPQTGILSDSLWHISSAVDEVYGLCCYHDPVSEEFYVFVNGKNGMVEQWEVKHSGDFSANRVRSFSLESQPEGMVADDEKGILYAGVEEAGIFYLDARANGDTTLYKMPGSDSLNTNIRYDIEGLAILERGERKYLMASSQGNFSYALYRIDGEPSYKTSFTIVDGSIDGVEDTDGLDILATPLGASYPDGILVVQDGFNKEGELDVSQNFKYISLSKVLSLLD